MKKILLISMIGLLLSGCEPMDTQPTEVNVDDYNYLNAEVKYYVDPDTNVEYLIFVFHNSNGSKLVTPRYNPDGTLKCLD